MISAIVAVDNNWGIGYNGELLEKIPEDMKYFKELTTNSVVIMGRKTWDSLPKKPLPNRVNIVITNQTKSIIGCDLVNGEYMKLNLKNLIFQLEHNNNNINYFIIGGGQIYKELLPYCEKVYLTKIHKSFDNVDTYFPNLNELDDWCFKCSYGVKTYKDFTYEFMEYDRIS